MDEASPAYRLEARGINIDNLEIIISPASEGRLPRRLIDRKAMGKELLNLLGCAIEHAASATGDDSTGRYLGRLIEFQEKVSGDRFDLSSILPGSGEICIWDYCYGFNRRRDANPRPLA